jgi:Peptidase A4 family
MQQVKKVSAAATATVALAMIAGIGAAGQALAAPATGAARGVPGAAARSASPAGSVAYPGYPVIRTATPAAARAQRTFFAINWSGYAVVHKGVAFRSIRATYYVPYVNCRLSRNSLSSHWVGFDGVLDKTVEQDGIQADCHGTRPSYRAWYELFPRPERRARLKISGGDSVTAAVSYRRSSRKFTFTIRNNTAHRSFRIRLRCQVRCQRSSAEVISEAPTVLTKHGPKLARLADYGAESYAGISITDSHGGRGGISSRHWRTLKIVQKNAGRNVAQPTPLHGPAFASYWFSIG